MYVTNQFKQGKNCSARHSKELFKQRFGKVFYQIESTWRREIKEQAPQLILLYRGRAVKSSHRRCCIRKLFLKILQNPQETPVLESIFKKVEDL